MDEPEDEDPHGGDGSYYAESGSDFGCGEGDGGGGDDDW